VTVVVDASVMLSALIDGAADGVWARGTLRGRGLVAPHLLPAEVANSLRRHVMAGRVSADNAASALAELVDLDVAMVGFMPHLDRVWELRSSVSAYDAWYVALAEELDAPLATLDRRLASAPGPRCAFLTR